MKMSRSKSQQHIDKFFKTKASAYQPGLIRLYGPTTGILLYQLLYWNGKQVNKSGWIFKTVKQIQSETGLSRSNQETAVRHLRNLDIIEYKLAQVPAKRHFKLQLGQLDKSVIELMKTNGLVYLIPPTHIDRNGSYSSLDSSDLLQKSTQEITTKKVEPFTYSDLERKRKQLAEMKDASK